MTVGMPPAVPEGTPLPELVQVTLEDGHTMWALVHPTTGKPLAHYQFKPVAEADRDEWGAYWVHMYGDVAH